mmetsp:Transcript_110219/g.355791  ORF Transcript_110219/g.355791 Transcript_110219/m.355791 type:complete len:262 (+) Transcript_110219:1389-2174(+)
MQPAEVGRSQAPSAAARRQRPRSRPGTCCWSGQCCVPAWPSCARAAPAARPRSRPRPRTGGRAWRVAMARQRLNRHLRPARPWRPPAGLPSWRQLSPPWLVPRTACRCWRWRPRRHKGSAGGFRGPRTAQPATRRAPGAASNASGGGAVSAHQRSHEPAALLFWASARGGPATPAQASPALAMNGWPKRSEQLPSCCHGDPLGPRHRRRAQPLQLLPRRPEAPAAQRQLPRRPPPPRRLTTGAPSSPQVAGLYQPLGLEVA